MPSSKIPVSGRAVALAVLFAVPSAALLILLRGYYAQAFPLLVGWIVLYAIIASRVLAGRDKEGDGTGG